MLKTVTCDILVWHVVLITILVIVKLFTKCKETDDGSRQIKQVHIIDLFPFVRWVS